MEQIIPVCGPAPAPDLLYTAWNVAPLPILALALLAAMRIPGVQKGPACAAAAALFLAFVSPLCALTVALFAARGLHHLVLVLVAAPALALAWPHRLPFGRIGSFIGLSAFLWLWHLPAAYTLAWESPRFYWLMQAGFLGSAWAFWSHVFHAEHPAERVASVGMVLALAGQMGLIAAILTFSPRILYLQHVGATEAYGLGALADQQLAGLVMWVPGMVPLALLGALLLRRGWREASLT
ncbi:cytochrome c oxidase assembly protein [Ancylobacter sp.]|uniref:cytochrome c oxidase assembly protein n=1 Tax=Ancylobacter sp. TaxID=1872567 RepID=UPI003D0B0562